MISLKDTLQTNFFLSQWNKFRFYTFLTVSCGKKDIAEAMAEVINKTNHFNKILLIHVSQDYAFPRPTS